MSVDKLRILDHRLEEFGVVEIPKELPLYDVVPNDPDLALLTYPLRKAVLEAVTNDYSDQRISQEEMTVLTDRFSDHRFSVVSDEENDQRQVWDILKDPGFNQ